MNYERIGKKKSEMKQRKKNNEKERMKNVERNERKEGTLEECWRQSQQKRYRNGRLGFLLYVQAVTDADGAGDCYISMKELETNVHPVAWHR